LNLLKIWSDGGPKLFKCNKNLAYFGTILNQKIKYNFFASCHGKGNNKILLIPGPCDGNLGVIKRYIKLKVKNENIEGVNSIKS